MEFELVTLIIGFMALAVIMNQSTISLKGSAGSYASPWGRHPRVQILPIKDLLSGAQLDAPPMRQVDRTFRKAPKVASADPTAPRLDFDGPRRAAPSR